MDYQANSRLGTYKRCKCGYADFDTDWGKTCENCNKPKEPEKD
jgi:hypothetical protein